MFRRFPLVQQSDGSDCGPAALATVALHYGLPVSVQQLRDLSGTDAVGTNLKGLKIAAERLGFAARWVHGPAESLPLAPLPAVAHIITADGFGHFVVVFKVSAAGVLVADPAKEAVRTLPTAEFTEQWTGYLLLLTPERLARDIGRPVPAGRRLLGLLAAHRGVLAEAVGCALLMTALGLANSYFLQHLLDWVFARQETRLLHAFGVGMAGVLVFKAGFAVVRQYLLAHVGRKVDLELVAGYARHLLGLPVGFFESRRVGEILSRMHDADKVREAVSGTALTVLVDGLVVTVMLALIWAYDPPLAAAVTAFVPLLVVVTLAHQPAAKRLSREAMERHAELSAHMVEDVSGVDTIRAYGAQPARVGQAEDKLVRMANSVFAVQGVGLSMGVCGLLITGAAGLAVLWYGGHRVMAGQLSVGQLLFFYSLVGYLLDPLERLASANLKIQDALIAVDRLGQVLDLPPEMPADGRGARFDRLEHWLNLEDVTFGYGCRGNALEGVNLYIPAGATVAVVGESGSGKSTLLKLLAGFYRPTAGRVVADGTDLRDIDLTAFRARVGLVSQELFVFSGTVRENIALGRPDANLEAVVRAARAAGLADFIDDLPDRYDTMLGERGANLSGGQRQRLAIARALLRDPDILLLDEATSHLDTATEQLIQGNLKAAAGGKTVLVVAHRLSTVRDADLIYVLHDGRVAESGTHAELIAANGRYAGLWRAQAGA